MKELSRLEDAFRRRRPRAAVVAALLVLVGAGDGVGQSTAGAIDADHSMNGIEAWNVAKTNGFTFRPLTFASGQSVTRPRDGVNTRLQAPESTLFGTRTVTLAQVVGGNASVVRPTRGSRTVTFEFFGGQKLAPGWKLKSVRLGGSYIWDRRPQPGTDDASFRVKATSSSRTTGAVTIRSLTLSGPYGATAEDAFVGRKTYTINGIEAWGVAKQYGFEFRPMKSTWRKNLSGNAQDFDISTPFDGVNTRLFTIHARSRLYLASVVGGNMIVNHWIDQRFVMFDRKRLAPGWRVQNVSVSGGRWIRQPAQGTDDLSFVLEVRGEASAHVRSITLEGPSNATGWQEAFQNASNP